MSEAEVEEALLRVNVAADQFDAAMRVVRDALAITAEQMAAFSRAIRGLGRRRRSGHRHRGTRDWRLRFAPGRADLPLGQRTMAKAR